MLIDIEQLDPAGIDSRTHSILLVDDSSVNLGVVVENLELQGYEILVAQDGEEAMQRAEVTLPDIILLDVMMAGMDGFEVCRRLKADERTRDIPVIFMTSLGRLEDKISGFSAGAVDYVTKPLQMDELRARIGAHLKLRDLQRQLEEKNQKLESEIGQRKKMEILLAESHGRLRQLLAHQENSREEERKKLASDMHEDLLQILATMQMYGRLMQSNSGGMPVPVHMTKTLLPLISGLGQSINLVRDMVVSLRPTVLNLGIDPALRWLADEFTKRHPGKACKLTCSDAEQMEEKSSLLVFRIVQEALEAAGNIAGANNVSITLHREEGAYLLAIRNEDAEDSLDVATGNFLNLSGLQERVIAMGGEMDMFSAPDHGLIIEAQIPVQDAG